VCDIDHLLVTPNLYRIVDYKTIDLSSTTTADLTDHYRPQMLAYALALLQNDSLREVRVSFRFTDAGVEERFVWTSDEWS
jgi:ATP-dependent helicase/nuclease subunit A